MSHYYSEKQSSNLNLKKIKIKLKDIEYELFTGSGVFSKNKLDFGSKLLIENSIIEKNWKIIDLGCGIGVIGISIKLIYPSVNILMTDINNRAVMLAKKNIKLNNLTGIKVKKSDLFENIKKKYDSILINPPQTAGKSICFKMIKQSFNHLNKQGLLQLVARHNKGGISLSNKMKQVFGNVKVRVKKSGYRVYVSKKCITKIGKV
jgi:16S rRNA G1207 methylase RsmC